MTEPETIAAQRLAKLREAQNIIDRLINYVGHKYMACNPPLNCICGLQAILDKIPDLDQPAPESNKCAECERLAVQLAEALSNIAAREESLSQIPDRVCPLCKETFTPRTFHQETCGRHQ